MKIRKMDVDSAAARYSNALHQYGPDNMTTIRAEIAYREAKDQYQQQTGKKYA